MEWLYNGERGELWWIRQTGQAITSSAPDSTCGLKNEGGVQEEENAGKERGNNSHIPLHAETMHL